MPGWYPDPAGAPNRFRYWDGQAWSADTTDNPGALPPRSPGLGPSGGSSGAHGPGSGANGSGSAANGPTERKRRLGPLIVALVTLVVLALVGTLVLRNLLGDSSSRTTDPGPLPTSTVSGWDDSSPTSEPQTPTPTPSMSRPTPTPTQSPEPTSEEPLQPCPVGQPTARQDHPSDGRVHGGGLSFTSVAGWKDSSGAEFSWAYDVGEQMKLAESPEWYANLAVGALFTGDGFDEPKRAAELVMQCVITSGLYPYFTDRTDIWSKATTVDGHDAWSIRADIGVADPQLKTKGDTVEVIVVDADSPESLSMFMGAANIGDEKLQRTLDRTIKDLRVD